MEHQEPLVVIVRCIRHLETGKVAICGGKRRGRQLAPERSTALVHRSLRWAIGRKDPTQMLAVIQRLQYHAIPPGGLEAFKLPTGTKDQVKEVKELLTGSAVILALSHSVPQTTLA